MGKGRGGGKTPDHVVQLLTRAVDEKSQSAVARESGLTLLTVQRYLKGIGEPSQDTLLKLASYFNVSVVSLRGEKAESNIEELLADGVVKGSCSRCGGEVALHLEKGRTGRSKIVATVEPCETCCKG